MKKNITVKVLEKIKYLGLRKLYYLVARGGSKINNFLIDNNLTWQNKYQSLTRYSISQSLIDQFGVDSGQNIDRKTNFLGFGLIHYAFVTNLKPGNILCVGSRMGFVPAIMALACKDNRYGHIDFVDAGYDQDQPAKHWSGIGFWKKVDAKHHFAQVGAEKYITTHVMTTREYAQKFPNSIYHYVYIDGDHSYEGVKEDYNLFWPRLVQGGFMIFHDVVARGCLDQGKFGVWKLWREIAGKNSLIFPFPKDSGLGIIQKL